MIARSLAPLAKLQNLRSLDLDNTPVQELAPLGGNPKLRIIGVPRQSREANSLAAAVG